MLPITVRSRLLSIMSNALLISILSIWYFHLCLRAFALIHCGVQTTSAVLRPRRKLDCAGPKCVSTAGVTLFRTAKESAFLIVFRRTIGRRLVTGPLGFPGFASGTRVPTPIPCEASLLVSTTVLMMFAIKGDKYSALYKGITPYMTVCSLATLTTKHSIICLYMVLYYDERRTTKLRT